MYNQVNRHRSSIRIQSNPTLNTNRVRATLHRISMQHMRRILTIIFHMFHIKAMSNQHLTNMLMSTTRNRFMNFKDLHQVTSNRLITRFRVILLNRYLESRRTIINHLMIRLLTLSRFRHTMIISFHHVIHMRNLRHRITTNVILTHITFHHSHLRQLTNTRQRQHNRHMFRHRIILLRHFHMLNMRIPHRMVNNMVKIHTITFHDSFHT